MKSADPRIKSILNLIRSAEKDLKKAQRMISELDGKSYEDVPGVLGVFDGSQMISADGTKYDINPNYIAKSMLVEGDNLKMVEEGGKQLFKQVSKVDRKTVSGVLNKKDGQWYAITDAGSYKLLVEAVDFRRGEINDEVQVTIPASNPNVEFAALEKLAKEDDRPIIGDPEDEIEDPKDSKGKKEKEVEDKKTEEPKKKAVTKKKTTKPKEEKEEDDSKKDAGEEVASILEEDDLR